MKILTLIIKQKYFDNIISDKKKEETRELRPSSEKRYVIINEDGAITDIIHYDAIRFFVGYAKDRDSALVEVTDTRLMEIVDVEDNFITYEYEGVEHQMIDIVYSLGNILEINAK